MTAKIQGKFYPLNHNEWVKACKELSSGARDVLYFIRTLDPYSNGVEISASAIASELNIHRTTVSRALKELDQKGYLEELIILEARVRLSAKGFLFEIEDPCENAQPCAEMHDPVQFCTPPCKIAQSCAEMHDPQPETQSQQAFQSPKNIKNIKNIQTLSEGEREKNLIFWEELETDTKAELRTYASVRVIPKLPEQPAMIDRWIECNSVNLFNQMSLDRDWLAKKNPRIANLSIPQDSLQIDLKWLKSAYPNNWKNAAKHFGVSINED